MLNDDVVVNSDVNFWEGVQDSGVRLENFRLTLKVTHPSLPPIHPSAENPDSMSAAAVEITRNGSRKHRRQRPLARAPRRIWRPRASRERQHRRHDRVRRSISGSAQDDYIARVSRVKN